MKDLPEPCELQLQASVLSLFWSVGTTRSSGIDLLPSVLRHTGVTPYPLAIS
jgi:hypothetical protein